jgi:hypothetical protein
MPRGEIAVGNNTYDSPSAGPWSAAQNQYTDTRGTALSNGGIRIGLTSRGRGRGRVQRAAALLAVAHLAFSFLSVSSPDLSNLNK